MTHLPDTSARTAVQITRAAPLFDRLAEAVIEHHASLEASQRGAALGSRANARLDALRERLDWFFPQFRDLYFTLLHQHIGPDLPAVLHALNDESVQRYLRALEAMRPSLLRALQQLGREMSTSLDPR
jgi:hypothetical protein